MPMHSDRRGRFRPRTRIFPVIEAVAAFPSAERCREELAPIDVPPADMTAAQVLLMLAAPLLVPRADEGDDFVRKRPRRIR